MEQNMNEAVKGPDGVYKYADGTPRDGRPFDKSDFKDLAEQLRAANDDGEFKALLSNNHNVILAALDRQSR
jgi:hypothetical protein